MGLTIALRHPLRDDHHDAVTLPMRRDPLPATSRDTDLDLWFERGVILEQCQGLDHGPTLGGGRLADADMRELERRDAPQEPGVRALAESGVAEIDLDGDDVVLRLSRLEKLGALRGDVRVPRAAVGRVRVASKPITELPGLLLPGTSWPKPRVALGTLRRRGGHRDFVAIHGRGQVLVVELDERSPRFERLLFSVEDAEETTRRLTTPG